MICYTAIGLILRSCPFILVLVLFSREDRSFQPTPNSDMWGEGFAPSKSLLFSVRQLLLNHDSFRVSQNKSPSQHQSGGAIASGSTWSAYPLSNGKIYLLDDNGVIWYQSDHNNYNQYLLFIACYVQERASLIHEMHGHSGIETTLILIRKRTLLTMTSLIYVGRCALSCWCRIWHIPAGKGAPCTLVVPSNLGEKWLRLM